MVSRITQLEALLKEEVIVEEEKTKVEDLEEELKEKIVEAVENWDYYGVSWIWNDGTCE